MLCCALLGWARGGVTVSMISTNGVCSGMYSQGMGGAKGVK